MADWRDSWGASTAAPAPTPPTVPAPVGTPQTAGPNGVPSWASSWSQGAEKATRGAKSPADAIQSLAGVKKVNEALGNTIQSGTGFTLNLLDATLGAPQRMIAGAVSGAPNDPSAGWWGHVKAGVYGGFHHDQKYTDEIQAGLEHFLGADRLKMQVNQHPQTFGEGMSVPLTKAYNGLIDLATQTLTDPLTYAGGLGILGKLGQAGKLRPMLAAAKELQASGKLSAPMAFTISKFIDGAESWVQAAKIRVGEDGVQHVIRNPVRSFFHPNAAEDYHFNDNGYYQATGFKRAATAVQADRDYKLSTLLKTHKDALKNAQDISDVPVPVRAHFYMEAIEHGDDTMRTQAIAKAKKAGINLDEYGLQDALKKPPSGLLTYNVRGDYVPNLQNMQRDFKTGYAGDDVGRILGNAAEGRAGKVGARQAGFEKGKKVLDQATGETNMPDNFYDAYKLRGQVGNMTIRQRMVQQKLSSEFGIALGENKWDTAKLRKVLNPWMAPNGQLDTAALQSYIKNPNRHLLDWVASTTQALQDMPFFRSMSNAMTRGITSNAIPHFMNVSRLSWLQGGPKGMAKGIAYGLRPDHIPDQVTKDLEEYGGTTNTFRYLPDDPAAWWDLPGHMANLPGLKQLNNVQHGALDKMDRGFRASAWENLTKRYPTKSKYEIAHMVDEAIGAYTATPAYAQFLKSIGGMFPLWHLRTVPTTTIKALMDHPERIMQMVRADEAANKNDVWGLKGKNMEAHPFAGSVYEATKLADAPLQMLAGQRPRYVESQSAIGPVGAELAYDVHTQTPINATSAFDIGANYLSASLGPAGQVAGEALNTHNSEVPQGARMIASIFGTYPEMKPIFWDLVAKYRAEGMSEKRALDQATKDAYGMTGGGIHLSLGKGLSLGGIK